MTGTLTKIEFPGSQGGKLAAGLEMPAHKPRAYALFAHCFTCSKDIQAARRIAGELSDRGIAVLRFDFTGLGGSEGEFANTSFASNVKDLVAAADFLRNEHEAPQILIGHSLGGAAILAAAKHIPETRAVATIGAPADVEHVLHNFACEIDEIERAGEAKVTLAGREFTITKQFLDDARSAKLSDSVATMKKALIVFHAPLDQTVGIENAGMIFDAAKHPKSFVSLDNADHLLSSKKDAAYVADVLASWAGRYISEAAGEDNADAVPQGLTRVAETGAGKFQQVMRVGAHTVIADEPQSYGGLDSGPSPYDLVSMALGACTSMTLRMYVAHKEIDLGKISVDVKHEKIHAKDCADCGEGRDGRIDRFERIISVDAGNADLTRELNEKLLEIADKCPVHRTLEASSAIVTRLADD